MLLWLGPCSRFGLVDGEVKFKHFSLACVHVAHLEDNMLRAKLLQETTMKYAEAYAHKSIEKAFWKYFREPSFPLSFSEWHSATMWLKANCKSWNVFRNGTSQSSDDSYAKINAKNLNKWRNNQKVSYKYAHYAWIIIYCINNYAFQLTYFCQ